MNSMESLGHGHDSGKFKLIIKYIAGPTPFSSVKLIRPRKTLLKSFLVFQCHIQFNSIQVPTSRK